MQASRPGSFTDVAVMALEATGKPMTCQQIIQWGLKKGRLVTSGKTPEKTLYASLSRSIMRTDHSPFKKLADGRFALRGWRAPVPDY